jgi:hypothetical protein
MLQNNIKENAYKKNRVSLWNFWVWPISIQFLINTKTFNLVLETLFWLRTYTHLYTAVASPITPFISYAFKNPYFLNLTMFNSERLSCILETNFEFLLLW